MLYPNERVIVFDRILDPSERQLVTDVEYLNNLTAGSAELGDVTLMILAGPSCVFSVAQN